MYDSLIIGSGPAGYTAAIYSARANLKVLCIEGALSGGQLMITTDVENYPGFPEAIAGPELMKKFREQAARFGTELITKDVTRVDFSNNIKKVSIGEEEYQTKTVIITTGATAKWLDVPNEKNLYNKGVSACATCDGFFFRGKEVAVIGGGDTAMEEALFLTKLVNKVTVIHRRDQLRASKIMQQRAFDNPKITFLWDSVVTEYVGQQKLEGLKIKNLKTNKENVFPTQGAFIAIGHEPATKIFKGHVELDEKEYIVRKENSMTSVAGVFVAGDVHDSRYKQAVTAAGYGCEAAIDAERWLEANRQLFL